MTKSADHPDRPDLSLVDNDEEAVVDAEIVSPPAGQSGDIGAALNSYLDNVYVSKDGEYLDLAPNGVVVVNLAVGIDDDGDPKFATIRVQRPRLGKMRKLEAITGRLNDRLMDQQLSLDVVEATQKQEVIGEKFGKEVEKIRDRALMALGVGSSADDEPSARNKRSKAPGKPAQPEGAQGVEDVAAASWTDADAWSKLRQEAQDVIHARREAEKRDQAFVEELLVEWWTTFLSRSELELLGLSADPDTFPIWMASGDGAAVINLIVSHWMDLPLVRSGRKK